MTPQERKVMKLALELLAVGTFHSPELQAKRTKVIAQGLEALAQPEHGWTPERIAGMARLKESQDKKLAQPEQEPVAWRNAAIRVGEDLCSVGPFGYYDMTAEQWLDWALSVVTVHAPPPQRTEQEQQIETLKRCLFQMQEAAKDLVEHAKSLPPPQRKPLTRGRIREIEVDVSLNPSFEYITPAEQLCRAIEAAHGIKE